MGHRLEKVCLENNCVGCSLCKSICNKNAIDIQIVKGFYRPIINDDCIGCERCTKICPANNVESINCAKHNKPSIAFAAWSKNDESHFQSTSGGMAFELARQFIKKDGFVVGVWFNSNQNMVEHRLYESEEELLYMRGSKYVQSNKVDIYPKIIKKLNDKKGLFMGVPCEVYAIKKYIEANNKVSVKDMYYVDILCKGAASPKCFDEHIKKVSVGKKIHNVTFRGGEYDCMLTLYGKNNKILYQDGQFSDPYFKLFMRHTILQPACFNCYFAGAKRVGDLTLGDFWGVDEEVKKKSVDKGLNMLFINSAKGQQLIDSVAKNVVMIERPAQEAIDGNEILCGPTIKEEEYDLLWTIINKHGFHKAAKEVYKSDWRKRFIKYKIKRYLKRL